MFEGAEDTGAADDPRNYRRDPEENNRRGINQELRVHGVFGACTGMGVGTGAGMLIGYALYVGLQISSISLGSMLAVTGALGGVAGFMIGLGLAYTCGLHNAQNHDPARRSLMPVTP